MNSLRVAPPPDPLHQCFGLIFLKTKSKLAKKKTARHYYVSKLKAICKKSGTFDRVFINGLATGKLTGWFGLLHVHVVESFSYKEVQIKFDCPVKTQCPQAENINKPSAAV